MTDSLLSNPTYLHWTPQTCFLSRGVISLLLFSNCSI